MSISDEQLMDLIKDVQTGNATKHDLAKAIQSEVYGLTYTVIQEEEESKKLTKNALAFICKNLDTFKAGLNVHRHIATLTSVYLYSQVSDNETNTTVDYVYEYDKVREDEELLDTFKADAKAFKNPTYLKKTSRRFRKLDEVQMVILQLFAYEMNSVNVISQMLEVDEEVVRSLIAETRGDLLGVEPDLVDDVDDAEYDEADEYDEDSAETSGDATGEEFAYDESGTDESQDEFYDETEDVDGEEAVLASGTMAAKVSATVDEDVDKDNCLTAALVKLFPTLTIKMRKVVTYCTAGVLALTIISVVVVALVMSRKTDSQALVDASSTDPTVETETETLADGSTIMVTKASTVAPGQTVPLELAPTVATKATTAAATEETEETTSADEATTGETETTASETPAEDKDKETTAASNTTTTAASNTTTTAASSTTTTAASNTTTTTAAATGTPASSETAKTDSASSETATTTAAAAN